MEENISSSLKEALWSLLCFPVLPSQFSKLWIKTIKEQTDKKTSRHPAADSKSKDQSIEVHAFCIHVLHLCFWFFLRKIAIWVWTVGLHQSPMWARCITILKIQAKPISLLFKYMLAASAELEGPTNWNYRDYHFSSRTSFQMYQTTLRNGSTKPKSTNNSLATLRQRQNYPTKEKTLHKKWVGLQLRIQFNKTLAREEPSKKMKGSEN